MSEITTNIDTILLFFIQLKKRHEYFVAVFNYLVF